MVITFRHLNSSLDSFSKQFYLRNTPIYPNSSENPNFSKSTILKFKMECWKLLSRLSHQGYSRLDGDEKVPLSKGQRTACRQGWSLTLARHEEETKKHKAKKRKRRFHLGAMRRSPSSFEAAHLDRWGGGANSVGLALLRSTSD